MSASTCMDNFRDGFFKLMKECTKAAGKDLESLSTSLSELHQHLARIKDTRSNESDNISGRAGTRINTRNVQESSSSSSLPFHEFSRSLLELETVRTGTSSEKRIQDLIDACLDLCGYQSTLMAAIGIIQERSKSDNHLLEHEHGSRSVAGSKSIAPVISSIHTVKRLLLVTTIYADTEYVYEESESGKDTMRPKCHHLINEYVSNWKNAASATIKNERFSLESAIKPFINMIILLPTQIANACYDCRIQLPSWATRSKIYSRLVECSAHMVLISTRTRNKESLQSNGSHMIVVEEASIESTYCACLLEKIVYLGSFESASSGMLKFWNHATNTADADAAHVLRKACTHIKSPRQSAALLCSTIKHTIAQIEIYSAEMTASQTDSLCKKHCLPYLEHVWLPILQSSSILRDAFVQLAVLAPSPTADVGEIKLLVRCVVLLLSSCQRHSHDDDDDDDDEVSDDSDSDSESSQSERYHLGNEVLMKYLAEVAVVWNELSFIRKTDTIQQRHVSLFIVYAIEFMDQNNHYTSRMQQMVAQELVTGITSRLKVTERTTRIDGMQVAEMLAPILGQSLNFEELDGTRDVLVQVEEDLTANNNSQKANESKMNENLATRKTSLKNSRRKRKQALKEIDPDEEYCSEDGSDFASDSESGEDDSICSSDSDWGEEYLIALELEDDEEDLRVVAKPNYLRECLDLLRSDGDDHEALCKLETALREIPVLVRDMPPDLMDVAVSLANELFHMENKFNLDDFTELRYKGLCSLAACEPIATVEYLQSQIFTEVSLGKRFDVLEVMKKSALELSGQIQMEENRKIRNKIDNEITKVAGKRRLVLEDARHGNSEILNSVTQDTVSQMKTRRWGRGRRTAQNNSVTNRFGPVAPAFFYPLLQGFLSSKSDEVIWGGESGGTLLSHLIIALSTFVENSGYHPGTAVLAKDLFELSWTFFVAENGEVRQAVLIALATCLSHLPEEYILRIVVGIEEVPRVLARTVALDTNENCRLLAATIQYGLQRSIML